MHMLLEKATLLKEGSHHLIYITKIGDGDTAVLKVLKPESHVHTQLSQLNNEWEISNKIQHSAHVRKAIRQVKIGNQQALVFPYIKGISLSEYIAKQVPSISVGLMIAIELSEAIATLHQQRILHRDITANNLILDEEEYTVTLIGFGLATNISIKTPFLGNPAVLQGSLHYMSPEQTGRLDRTIDERSDLYSLGVVLYQLFSGQLPFQGLGALELVHQHLAILPKVLNSLNENIPDVISKIVTRLLQKDPDRRYQSATGLKHDLEHCFAAWQEQGLKIKNFVLGQEDYTDKLVVPATVYGREAEVGLMQQALANASKGQGQVIWIKGLAGVGKSSLVKEIYQFLPAYNAIMAQGKFASLSAEPFSALITGFNHLIEILLIESEERLVQWKVHLKDAIGAEGSVLFKLIPKLELLLDDLPKAAPVEGVEAQARLTFIFNQFVKALAQAEHPFVLFLDDLQWADTASMAAITSLVNNSALNHFLLICSYRPNEVDDQHPLRQLQKQAVGQPGTLASTAITLTNLHTPEVASFLSAILHLPVNWVTSLAQVIVEKTGGNPLFVQQILQLLQEKGILYFGQSTYLTAGDTKPRWQWDLFKIKKLQLSQNLADILGSKINQLPEETLKLLQVGSVIGNTFNESQVAQLSHLPESSVLGILTLALDQGLLLLTQYPENQEFANEFENSRTYQFSHDRIHHAVLSSISQQSRVLLDFKVAQNLQQHPKFGNTPALVFAATTHTNMATALVIESGQFSEAIGLNLKASHWAKEALAYKQAYKFIKAAIDFGNKGAWQGISISTKISVYLLASEIAFLTSLHDQVMPLSDVVLAESDNKIRKAKAYELRTLALIASNQAGAAISNALEGLNMLGINLPRKAEKGTIALDLLKSAVKLQGKKTEDLVSLPTMVDEKAMAAMRIMASMGSAVSRSAPTLFPLLVGQLIRLSIRYGNSVESIPAYSGYGILQSAAFTKPANAYRFGQVALELVERLQARQMIPKTYIVVYSFLDFLKNPIQNCYAPLMKAYQIGLEVGDHEFAATALMVRGIHGLLAGQALPELEEQYATYALRVANLNQTLLALQLSMFRQVVNNLRSESLEESLSFSGEFFNEQAVHKSFLDENRAAYFYINFCKLYQWVYQRNFSNAVSILPEMEAELEAVQGTLLYPNYLFYRSLVLLQHYHKTSDTQKKAYNKKIKKGLNHLQKLARFAPSNFLNKYYLIKAEINRVKNQPETAFNAYNQAAAYAHQHNLLPEEALAYELAGRYYSSGHFNYPAPLFLQKAHDLYLQWGTTQLAHAISREYLYVYSKTPKQASSMVSTIPGSTSVLHNYSALELGSILKASTAIASEIQLEKFLNTLLPILIENAGAQKGCLLLQQQWPKWSIAAYSEAGQKATHESDSIKNIRREQTLQDIPTTIVHYVARTRQELIIKNAQHDARFKSDSSIQKLGIKSILCIPVISKGNPIAILYLENNLAGSAFTANQLETLKILTGQIAISLENAMLYDQLELKVKERTQQLEENQRELERKNKALRDLNTEKDELVSIVAHDLRSPLNQIRGMANLIKLEEGTLSNDQKNYVDLISQSGERLGQMITNILSATSNADSKPKLQIEPININDLAQELVIHNIIGAKNKGIELIFDAKKEPLFVAIDRNYCFQALENLISNAIKFSPPNKQIIIRVSEVKAHQDNNMIRIEVQDEGPGITARDRKRLFSRFQTLSAKPTAGEASSGLGLSISKRFIEAMGGEIGVESEPGQGATFYVNLPKPSEAEA